MLTRIPAELQRIESGSAIFVLDDGQEVRIPKQDIEPASAIGTRYVFQVLPEAEAHLEQEALAKTLLNQIMSNHEAA
jgi:hypothetical protein